MNNPSIIDQLIANVSHDQSLLQEAEERIVKAKEEKKAIQDRLRDYQKEAEVMMKYATEEQIEKLNALDLDFSPSKHGLNTVATITYDIMLNTKKKSMTNEELYDAYVDTLDDKHKAVTYTIFNVKCRPLFNNQRLLRKKGSDPKSSRTDVITLNGSTI
jgi:DNA helicase IV